MQYAMVGNERREAYFGGRGSCPVCQRSVLAKCGPRVLHHWAHTARHNCDPWWENETQWHRDWKSLFPPEWREISLQASDGEIHRADLRTANGVVVEFQHSSITDAERVSRELFYQNMVWVIDGSKFQKNFDIYHRLPHPASDIAQDIVWAKATRGKKGAATGFFFQMVDPYQTDPSVSKHERAKLGGWIHSIREVERELEQAYRGHHQYDWVRPHRTWLDAKTPVYIDIGEAGLAKLAIYDESGLPCVQLISKDDFVAAVSSTSHAEKLNFRTWP